MNYTCNFGRSALLAVSLLALAACSETTTSDTAAPATTGAGSAEPAQGTSGAGAGSSKAAETMTEAMPTDTPSFVATAASSDMFEIQSSQLAKERGVGGEVAGFAEQMIRDHTATSTEMKSLLSSMSPPMSPPAEMSGKHQAMLAKVREAGNGPGFTRAYVDAQRDAHNEAVALYTAYSQKGDNPALRQFAQKTLPALQSHLEHVRQMEAKR